MTEAMLNDLIRKQDEALGAARRASAAFAAALVSLQEANRIQGEVIDATVRAMHLALGLVGGEPH